MKKLLLLLLSIYVLMLGYLYLTQRSFIYFPSLTRPVAAVPNYELINGGLRLKGWALNEEKSDAILYFGGNGERLEHNLPQFRRIFENRAVYMLSYRGYGSSDGEPSETGIYSDALALYDTVQKKHGAISVIGRSLGSGVATYVAAKREAERVVLITPFANIVDLAKRQFPIFPVGLLLKDRYLSDERVDQIKAKTLIIYAGNDQVVTETSTKKLIVEFAPEQVEVVKVNGAGHNSISDFPEYEKKLVEFFVLDTAKLKGQNDK